MWPNPNTTSFKHINTETKARKATHGRKLKSQAMNKPNKARNPHAWHKNY